MWKLFRIFKLDVRLFKEPFASFVLWNENGLAAYGNEDKAGFPVTFEPVVDLFSCIWGLLKISVTNLDRSNVQIEMWNAKITEHCSKDKIPLCQFFLCETWQHCSKMPGVRTICASNGWVSLIS